MYIHLCSADSLKHHKQNTVTRFTIKLPEHLTFTGHGWMCGLSQIELRNVGAIQYAENAETNKDNNTPFSIYIASDIVDHTHTGFGKFQILKRLPVFHHDGKGYSTSDRKNIMTETFNPISYTPLRLACFSEIDIYLKGDNWKSLNLSGVLDDDGETIQPRLYCALHLIQRHGGKGKICHY